jgi:hypothetical protein
MPVGWACGRARGRGALREGPSGMGWDGMEGEGSGMGGWEIGEGGDSGVSGFDGALGFRRARIDLKPLHY